MSQNQMINLKYLKKKNVVLKSFFNLWILEKNFNFFDNNFNYSKCKNKVLNFN